MIRSNPISPKRLQFLTQQLYKKLEKSKQLDLWKELEPKLKFLGDSDPSSSGEYCHWIIQLLLRKSVDLPEDSEKLRELLTTFHRVKSRLPKEFRDINQFKSYSQLRITLLPMLPTLKSISELEQEGSKLLATVPIKDNVYQIYQLTTPEAASAAAKNSGWCVCNKDTAADYLKDGPLYLIAKNDSRFILAHAESNQVMDVNDIPIHPDEEKHHYREIHQLFEQFLPKFLCSKHWPIKFKWGTEDPGKAPGQELAITNLICNECETAGCIDCGFDICGASDCTNELCADPDHKCSSCSNTICSEHIVDCCRSGRKERVCHGCASKCKDCGELLCGSCGFYVECCEESVCESHYSASCGSCNTSYCNRCGNFTECNSCNKLECEECASDWVKCKNCEKGGYYTCDDCVDKCSDCGYKMCAGCAADCNNCDNKICRDCSSYCSNCEEVYCSECQHQECHYQEIKGRRNHNSHGEFKQCGDHPETDEDGNEFEEPPIFCSTCMISCAKCGKDVCDECIETCQCDQKHPMCQKCNQVNICPVCGEAMCVAEQHLSCAYTRRRKLRRQ